MHVHPRRPVPGNVAFNTKLGKPGDRPKGQWDRHTWESCAAVKKNKLDLYVMTWKEQDVLLLK